MVEMVLAGVIVALVAAIAAATGVRDRRRRAAERVRPPAQRPPGGEPIPGGWAAADGCRDGCDHR